ncbi:MAG: hypothetical protein ACOYXC_15670 [Candidatus Rifleibacteriota bacterium]
MSETQFSECDICTDFITPALEHADWNIATQVREGFPITCLGESKVYGQ